MRRDRRHIEWHSEGHMLKHAPKTFLQRCVSTAFLNPSMAHATQHAACSSVASTTQHPQGTATNICTLNHEDTQAAFGMCNTQQNNKAQTRGHHSGHDSGMQERKCSRFQCRRLAAALHESTHFTPREHMLHTIGIL